MVNKKNKSKNNNINLNTLILISIIILFGVGINEGWFSGLFTINVDNLIDQDFPEFPYIEPVNATEDPTFFVNIRVLPNPGCIGDVFTGQVKSNMANGVCRLWFDFDDTVYEKLTDFMLDGNGEWSYSERILASGTADFQALCIKDGKYAVSNRYTLVVNDCSGSDDSSSGSDQPMLPPCESIVSPTSQASCDIGLCSGINDCCVYVAADLVNPAKCECLTCPR